MKGTYSVLAILKSICENTSSRSVINNLIELSHNYACTYLKYRYKNLDKILLTEDITLKEMALDAIAPLFERNEKGEFVRIAKAFNNWQPKIDNEEMALFFVNRIISKATEKYVSEILRQSDPFFSRILDSITYLIEKNNYKKKLFLGTVYIIENDWDNNISYICNLPDSTFINELPVHLFIKSKNVISEVFNYIKSSTDKTHAIPLNALVLKIKQVNSSSFMFSDSFSDNEIEIKSIVQKSLNTTFEKLKVTYLDKNKIPVSEAVSIQKALETIASDLCDGGINAGLHKYLIEQMPDLCFEEYKIRYQNIFEYLFKVLKMEITEQLK